MDNVVSQPVRPETPGVEYTVIWRVVSSDGHPIEGTFGFTAQSGGAGASSLREGGQQPAFALSEGQESTADGTFPLGPMLGSVAALLLLLEAGVMWVARRKGKKGPL